MKNGYPVTKKYSTVDGYMSALHANIRPHAKELRSLVRKVLPRGIEETISYGIPAFKVGGRSIVYIAGWKTHVALYPIPKTSGALKKEVLKYQSGRGTLKFPLDKPLPKKFIVTIIKLRLQEHEVRVQKMLKKK